MTTEITPKDHPFNHIALSLSGGGVRAAGYHLGTLDYLEHAGLLSEVHTLSSVSGGTMVAIGYALSLKKNESFQDFYDNICEFLPELNTFEELLKILKSPVPPVASGSRSLITAMAIVYRDQYFNRYYGDPTFEIFWDDEPDIPLKEIIFNATEFKTGMAFRFQKSQLASRIGNSEIWIDEKHAKQIRMSDMMAASSCIPGAMEPINFPQDFHWPGDPEDGVRYKGKPERTVCNEVEQYLQEHFGISSVPLMDGGVYDNQGITSVILSAARNFRGAQANEGDDHDERAALEPQRAHAWAKWLLRSMEQASDLAGQKDMGDVDMFIVSDTPVHRDPMYQAQNIEEQPAGGIKGWARNLRLHTINIWGWVLTVVLSIAAFDGIRNFWTQELSNSILWLDVPPQVFILFKSVTLTVPVILVGLVVFALMRLRVAASDMAERITEVMPPIRPSIWSYAKTLRLGQLLDMAVHRAGSMSALTSRIFMNRIRQLGYSLLYSHDEFGKRVMDNNINDIKTMREGRSDDLPDFVKSPSDAIIEVIDRASSMGTKLWIDKPDHDRHDLDVLIAAGHVSTCFNIIEYLWEFHRDENNELNANVQALFERTRDDWDRLNDDPYWLVDRRKNQGRDEGGLFWKSSRYDRKRWQRKSRKTQPASA